MTWHDYPTSYKLARLADPLLKMKELDWYERHVASLPQGTAGATICAAEMLWVEARKPYFNVHRGWGDALTRVRLDIDGATVPPLPVEHLLIRFQKGGELQCGPRKLLSMFVMTLPVNAGLLRYLGAPAELLDEQPWHRVCITCHFQGSRLLPGRQFALRSGVTVEASLAGAFPDIFKTKNDAALSPDDLAATEKAAKLVCMLGLLSRSPEYIEQDVLADDRHKAAAARANGDQATIDKLVERAKRRGVVGWSVGARSELSPHYRVPHLGLRWTGEGRTVPKLVSINGCVVHRRKVTEVPTGYLGDEGE